MAKKKDPEPSKKSLRLELITQMLNLATSGFGLVAALAWNDAIQSFVKDYIKTIFPQNFGIISQFIYAVLVTVLAVLITFQLSQMAARIEASRR